VLTDIPVTARMRVHYFVHLSRTVSLKQMTITASRACTNDAVVLLHGICTIYAFNEIQQQPYSAHSRGIQ